MARGAIYEGGALLCLAGALAMLARRRSRPATSPNSALPTSEMSETEARSMLGVDAKAGADEIERAYKRLMLRVHPDLGGAGGLATQLNAARAVLIKAARSK